MAHRRNEHLPSFLNNDYFQIEDEELKRLQEFGKVEREEIVDHVVREAVHRAKASVLFIGDFQNDF